MKLIPYLTLDVARLRRKLREGKASDRKCRLFAVACCRLTPSSITHRECLALVDLAELFADGGVSRQQLVRARETVHEWAREQGLIGNDEGVEQRWLAQWGAFQAASTSRIRPVYGFLSTRRYRPLLADIFGPTARETSFDTRWRTEHTVGIAGKMYDERDFAAMPILADALQEAGCENAAILTHCREPGVHVRGCWVVDLVLGKG